MLPMIFVWCPSFWFSVLRPLTPQRTTGWSRNAPMASMAEVRHTKHAPYIWIRWLILVRDEAQHHVKSRLEGRKQHKKTKNNPQTNWICIVHNYQDYLLESFEENTRWIWMKNVTEKNRSDLPDGHNRILRLIPMPSCCCLYSRKKRTKHTPKNPPQKKKKNKNPVYQYTTLPANHHQIISNPFPPRYSSDKTSPAPRNIHHHHQG